MNSIKISLKILKWLEVVLKERFGFNVRLDSKQDSIYLTADNNSGFISVKINTLNYISKNYDLPYTTWDAGNEGWHVLFNEPIPAPGYKSLLSPLVKQKDGNYYIQYDILGLTYWMLSRQEEVDGEDLDQYDRFPATSSHAYKYNYLERPVVDEWLYILAQVINKRWPTLNFINHQFNITPSHDVDAPSRYGFCNPKRYVLRTGFDLIKRRDINSFFKSYNIRRQTQKRLHDDDPFNTFNWIMDLSEKHNLCSAFYFMCGRTDLKIDSEYEIEDPAIRALIRDIHHRDHEVGVHPSFNSYQAPEIIKKEVNRLKKVCREEGIEQKIWGGRMHYLRWETSTTLRAWADAGMDYESTLSYADHAGFRCGTCFEYPAFDPKKCEPLNIRVRPLIAMDCTVMGYMGLGTGEEAYNKFMQLKNACKLVSGNFTILWHNSELLEESQRELYMSIIEN